MPRLGCCIQSETIVEGEVLRAKIARVGADLAKRVIQVHAVDALGKLVTNKALARDKFFIWCAHHRRLCSRMDKPKAITASAHKLARLVYFMLTKGQAFVEAGQDEYEERYRQRVVQNLTRRAQQLGFQLTPQGTSPA